MSESKALQRQWSLLPSTLGEAMEVAKIIADSEFAPRSYKGQPHSVLIAIQMGADLGLAPMQSLQNIAVINGRPSLWGDAALALAMSALEYVKESYEGTPFQDDYGAVCEVKRKGWPEPTIRKFTVADAKKASLWGKQNTPWQSYPNRMLQMRARGFALRDVAPDRLMGFILAEEAMDLPNGGAPEVPVGSGQTVEAKSLTVFKSLPEPVQDNIDKAFKMLNLSEAQGLMRMNEFLGGPDVVPDEGAQRLLDWARDEFAKRKTGMPRAKADGNKKKPTEAPVDAAKPKANDDALEFQ